jgi:hypothetical protein
MSRSATDLRERKLTSEPRQRDLVIKAVRDCRPIGEFHSVNELELDAERSEAGFDCGATRAAPQADYKHRTAHGGMSCGRCSAQG